MKKVVLSIKQCVSFATDQLFSKARRTLKEAGIEWRQLFGEENIKLNEIIKAKSDQFTFPAMDTVFFHQDRFEVLIDARGFRPEDIKCTITPNLVEVIGQRIESMDSASRRGMSLTRSYQLPQPVKPEEGACCISSEGVLLITAPWFK